MKFSSDGRLFHPGISHATRFFCLYFFRTTSFKCILLNSDFMDWLYLTCWPLFASLFGTLNAINAFVNVVWRAALCVVRLFLIVILHQKKQAFPCQINKNHCLSCVAFIDLFLFEDCSSSGIPACTGQKTRETPRTDPSQGQIYRTIHHTMSPDLSDLHVFRLLFKHKHDPGDPWAALLPFTADNQEIIYARTTASPLPRPLTLTHP